jgi:hypothetical protein
VNPHEHELHYPWPDVPALGAWTTLRPGVHWVRMPLPFALDHINLWVLDDEVDGRAGYTVVDSGITSDVTKQAWEQLFAAEFGGLPMVRLICTHFHPDHFGLAWWLVAGGDRARWKAPLWMSATEYAFGRFLSLGADQTTGDSAIRSWCRRAPRASGACRTATRSRSARRTRSASSGRSSASATRPSTSRCIARTTIC